MIVRKYFNSDNFAYFKGKYKKLFVLMFQNFSQKTKNVMEFLIFSLDKLLPEI